MPDLRPGYSRNVRVFPASRAALYRAFTDPAAVVGRAAATEMFPGQPVMDSLLAAKGSGSGLQALVTSWGGPTSLGDLGFRTSDVPRAAELTTKRPFANPREVRHDDLVALLISATDRTRIGANR